MLKRIFNNKKKMNKLSNSVSIIKCKLGGQVPLILSWKLTDDCDFNCCYCNSRKRGLKGIHHEVLKKAISRFYKLGTRRIGFTGGEPLLYKNISDIIEHSRKLGIYTSISTNGWQLDKKIDVIKNIDEVIISLDGRRSFHDKNRRKGSYDKIIRFLKKNSQNHITTKITTASVITKNSIDNINHIIELSKKYGFNCSFQIVRDMTNLSPKEEELKNIVELLINSKKKGISIIHSYSTLRRFLKNPHNTSNSCYAGKIMMMVDSDGYVFPCHDIKGFNPKSIFGGVDDAVENCMEKKCNGCSCNAYTEINQLITLHPETIYNALRNF
jgi:MoaA/NifB/PqqE/SkfB family radical SAM enzyme